MDRPSSATTANSRLKRVLPSRSRRGGQGLGTCDVDNLILETGRRKYENEPLLPSDTRFLLTTDPSYDASPSDGSPSGTRINVVANKRYFDRPDVLKAFREQRIIQTPEFYELQELVSGVGGIFWSRNQEDPMPETSDAAYEKRHKKFETYEKRQRLRENERLKHEHYKLKERIDQLRAMEGAAFMNLPESSFSPAAYVGGEDVEEDPTSVTVMNGDIYHPEGEHRRKEMLDIAVQLERRYAYLNRGLKGQESLNVAAASTRIADQGEEDPHDGCISTAGPTPSRRRSSPPPNRLPPPSPMQFPPTEELQSLEPQRPSTSPASSAPPTLEQDSPPPDLSQAQGNEVADKSAINGMRIIQLAPASMPLELVAQNSDVQMQPSDDHGEMASALSEEPKALKTAPKSRLDEMAKKHTEAKSKKSAVHAQEQQTSEPVGEDSISVCPSKRRRKDTSLLSVAARTSVQPSERERATLAARPRGPIPKYFPETDACKVQTNSTLIIAAIRNQEQKRSVARDRYAFGLAAPDFQKQNDVDFDLPMYFRFSVESSQSGDETEEKVDQANP